jgi:hypothetical protein
MFKRYGIRNFYFGVFRSLERCPNASMGLLSSTFFQLCVNAALVLGLTSQDVF